MGYNQYVELRLRSENLRLGVEEAKLDCGKFYETGDKDKEVSSAEIDKITVNNGKWSMINSCGRHSAMKGTEGSITIKDLDTQVVLGKYKWDCPYWSSGNTSQFTWDNEELKAFYYIQLDPGTLSSGPIGKAFLLIVKY